MEATQQLKTKHRKNWLKRIGITGFIYFSAERFVVVINSKFYHKIIPKKYLQWKIN
jgi:hypothetical protein